MHLNMFRESKLFRLFIRACMRVCCGMPLGSTYALNKMKTSSTMIQCATYQYSIIQYGLKLLSFPNVYIELETRYCEQIVLCFQRFAADVIASSAK